MALDRHLQLPHSQWCEWCEETFQLRMQESFARYAQYMENPIKAGCGRCTFDFMEPVAHCELEKRDGIHDGPKWTCGSELLQPPCLVYSFGSAGRYEFERSVRKEAGGAHCEMHIFDSNPKFFKQVPIAQQEVNATYHTYGISAGGRGAFGGTAGMRFKGLVEIMTELGHVGRRIDILKMDVEGAEYTSMRPVFERMAAGEIQADTFLVELHSPNPNTLLNFAKAAHDAGLLLYHKERNNWASCTAAVEFAFASRDFLRRVYRATHCPFCQ